MCGIAGYWKERGSSGSTPNLKGALESLQHRGPDDCGIEKVSERYGELGLGHRRLSIIDLSEGGHQPMHSADRRYSLVFNGEIYNYRELKALLTGKGAVFKSDSDTEVLLEAWQQLGEGCIKLLCGMFAFVIVDHISDTITLVRDAFGIKPLFYAYLNNCLYFASELPALLRLIGTRFKLNVQRAYDYLVHADYDSQTTTFIEGIYQLAPGTQLSFNTQSSSFSDLVTWWCPDVRETRSISFADAADRLRSIFLENVRCHLRSDVPLGAALSGGIDSSAVVCAMRYLEPSATLNTFSFIAKNSKVSEESWVNLVNRAIGATAHSVTVEANDLARDLDDMILAQGEPFGSTSIYAQYRVFKLASEHGVTVTLDGQGADELLAGYHGYPGKRLQSLLDGSSVQGAASFLRSWAQWPGRSLGFGLKAVASEYLNGSTYELMRNLAGFRAQPKWLYIDQLLERGVSMRFPRQTPKINLKGRRLVSELGLNATRRGLPALLRHADRNSMRFSVESRVPFLTTELADFVLSLPEDYLVSKRGETKSVFRAAMRGIVPGEILDRRDKIGFSTPEQDWLIRLAGKSREWIREESGIEFLNNAAILEEFDRIIAGKAPFSMQVWRWINFSRWYTTVFLPLSGG